MATIKASIGLDHYRTVLESPSGNQILADEPLTDGGTDQGFSPSELLASALATCTCVTLRMYADRKGWKLQEVHTNVTFTRDESQNASLINREITLVGPELTEEERHRLLQIANKCFIHKTLTNPIHIHTVLTAP